MSSLAMNNTALDNHTCLIYQTEEEQQKQLSVFFQYGLTGNEKILYVDYNSISEKIISSLQKENIDMERYLAKGQILFLDMRDIFYRNQTPGSDIIFNYLNKEIKKAHTEGFSALRITAEAIFTPELHSVEQLVKIESILNNYYARFGDNNKALCQYDIRKHESKTLRRVLRAHPLVLLKNELLVNHCYLPPQEFATEKFLDENSDQAELDHAKKLEKELIYIKIENLRNKLKDKYNQGYDINKPTMIALSQELDEYISCYYQKTTT